uniref:Uncharacterized protein n=1 Tax=Arundo donax TaxID=35708 RepID=A0A0A9C419_ARUDO
MTSTQNGGPAFLYNSNYEFTIQLALNKSFDQLRLHKVSNGLAFTTILYNLDCSHHELKSHEQIFTHNGTGEKRPKYLRNLCQNRQI